VLELMAIFGGSSGGARRANQKPSDPKWVRSPKGGFYQLLSLDPDELNLRDVGGVYVIWHGGVRPQWVYVGETPSLARALNNAMDDEEIAQYDINGKLFVSWSPVVEKLRRGVVLYLTQSMSPLVENPRAPKEETKDTYAIPVIAPGAKA